MEIQIAYFSAEFGIQESLPIYSGGLGVLAGDYIKSANDLDIPLTGIGILYRRGYFEQSISLEGRQKVNYPELDLNTVSNITLVRQENGEPIHIEVPIEQRVVYLQVWRVGVGSVSVYLLDADVPENLPSDRRLTDRLYGGDAEHRICHEIILGIGGVRTLRQLSIDPAVWHINEGHAAFSALERIREYTASGLSLYAAVEAVRPNSVFTTHTPVPAGHDVFGWDLMEKYFAKFSRESGILPEDLFSLGKQNSSFNMTRLALNTSSKINGVSQIHAQVSQDLIHQWVPHIPAQDISVDSITNGVHADTWLSPELKDLIDMTLGRDWRARISEEGRWNAVKDIPDAALWAAHQQAKQRMIDKLQLPRHLEHCLVIGFARRFATYKRATLILSDLTRLSRILNNSNTPVCFVFAGKAHPNDRPGQDLIREIVETARKPPFQNRLYFVENYDLAIAKLLVQGTDVWLNTPVKPMEASGTSGQKAGINGVLNCSILDGWWFEAYNGQNGWAIPASENETIAEYRDVQDSRALYQLLEQEIVPLYSQREEAGYPYGWIQMMKASVESILPVYNTHRMILEYWHQLYRPASVRGSRFSENSFEVAKRVAEFKQFIRTHWHEVAIESRSIHDSSPGDLKESIVSVHVQLGPIWYKDVRVEAVGSNERGDIWRILLHHIGTESLHSRDNSQNPETVDDVVLHVYQGFFPGSLEDWRRQNANIRVFPVSQDFSANFEMELSTWGE